MTPEKTALLRSATTRIEWLRILFELSERDLPGERDLRTAREALDCFKLVNNVKLVVKSSVFKLDISKSEQTGFWKATYLTKPTISVISTLWFL